jgi:mannosyltransferase OCH1-like enzyme
MDAQALCPDVESRTGIPRIIHQTYFTHDFPASIKANVDRIRATNPTWEYRFYDDESIFLFIQEAYGQEILKRYLQINPRYGAARADLFRYLLLYKTGGVYLDIKSTTTSSLDSVLKSDDQFVLSHWRNRQGERYAGWGMHPKLTLNERGEFQQWHIIAAPGHPFLKAVIMLALDRIDSYKTFKHGVGYFGVLHTTGPICYTQAILPLIRQYQCRILDGHEALGLEYAPKDGNEWTHRRTAARPHYSRLREPVVVRTLPQKLLVRASRAWDARFWHRSNQYL